MLYKTAKCIILIVAITFVLSPSSVQAKRFSDQDHVVLDAITKRLETASRDSLDAAQASITGYNVDASDCLTGILDATDVTDEIISSASTLTFLSGAMANLADEQLVDRFLELQIKRGLSSIAHARRVINLQSGRCGTSAIVANKAQLFLSILDDGERVLSAFSRRF
jgi:hypothetical protein